MRRIRTRFFIGVEGEGESGFIVWLKDIADNARLQVHYDVRVLGGGDPLHMVQKARRELRQAQHGFAARVLLLDSDRFDADRARGEQARQLAHKGGFRLLLQQPDQEAVLLRLHAGHEHDLPVSPALRPLQRVWPDYAKPTSRKILADRFATADLHRARLHDPMLDDLLTALHLTRAITATPA